MQIKLGKNKTVSFRKLSAMAIAKRVGLPIPSANESQEDAISKFIPKAIDACAVNATDMDTLTIMDIGAIMTDKEFGEYINGILGEFDDAAEELPDNDTPLPDGQKKTT